MERVSNENIGNFIKSFKKNSWVAKKMFESDITEITIKRELYNFTISMYIPNNESVNIPFQYKPNKRKRKLKKKEDVKYEQNDNYVDSGYETNYEDNKLIKNKNFKNIENESFLMLNKMDMNHDGQDKDKIIIKNNEKINTPSLIFNNNCTRNINSIHKINKVSQIIKNIDISNISENNKNKNFNNNYIFFGDVKTNIKSNNTCDIPLPIGNFQLNKNNEKQKTYNSIYNLFQDIISKLTLFNDILEKANVYNNSTENIMLVIVNSILEVDHIIKNFLKI